MIVAASDVTNSFPRWLINSLFRPAIVPRRKLEPDITQPEQNTHHWVRNLSSRDLIALPLLGYSVARHLLDQTYATRAQETETNLGRKTDQTYLVTILEKLEVLCFWDLQRHGGRRRR